MNYDSFSDESLVKEMASSTEAFSILYTRHFTPTRDFLVSNYRLPFHEAEDVTQRAFIKVFKHAASFRGGCKFKTWLFTIARNIAYDGLRKPDRKNLSLNCGSLPDEPDFSFAAEDLSTPTPAQAAEDADTAEAIAKNIEKAKSVLSLAQKQIFDLIFLEGKGHKEVAAIMDCPVGTVMSRAFAVRKKLSKAGCLVSLR